MSTSHFLETSRAQELISPNGVTMLSVNVLSLAILQFPSNLQWHVLYTWLVNSISTILQKYYAPIQPTNIVHWFIIMYISFKHMLFLDTSQHYHAPSMLILTFSTRLCNNVMSQSCQYYRSFNLASWTCNHLVTQLLSRKLYNTRLFSSCQHCCLLLTIETLMLTYCQHYLVFRHYCFTVSFIIPLYSSLEHCCSLLHFADV